MFRTSIGVGAAAGLSLAAALATAVPASAADMPGKAASATISQVWTGPYVGGHLGAAWAEYDYDAIGTGLWTGGPAIAIQRLAARQLDGFGAIGGIQAGYNFQVARALLGLEADFSGLWVKEEFDTGVVFDVSGFGPSQFRYSAKVNWLSTTRLRFGYVSGPGDSLVVFATGGVAIGEVESSFNHFRPASGLNSLGSARETLVGWTVGGGIEYLLTPNWTLKGEYLYADLGRTSTYISNPQPGFCLGAVCFSEAVSMGVVLQVARLGINYKF